MKPIYTDNKHRKRAEYMRLWYAKKPGYNAGKCAKYLASNRERNRIACLKYHAEHRDEHCKKMSRYWANLSNEAKHAHSIQTSQYHKKHPEKINAITARYRCSKRNAMPPWVDPKKLAPFYDEAKKRSLETGMSHHVDHIWPLKGNGFVGLHVPWNLQVLTAIENISKGNKVPA